MKIAGKNIIVTGAAKRLGREIALSLAKTGANIAIHYNSSKKEAEELSKIITDLGRKTVLIKGDISKSKDCTRIIEKAHKAFGELHLLINCAAIFRKTPFTEVSEKDWSDFLGTNLTSQFFLSREFAKLAASGSKIINFSDSYAVSPSVDFIPYGVSKGSVLILTRALAKTLAPQILVNAICPGPVLPPEHTSEASQSKAISSALLKKSVNIEDIIKTVHYLAENDSITGQAVFVDGGKGI